LANTVLTRTRIAPLDAYVEAIRDAEASAVI